GFVTPPIEARPRALWDWVDGNFQLEEITREMEEAVRMGMGGFDIWDVRSVVDEDSIVPAGPPFMGDESLEAICFAINEAERLGLDLGLIIASGWNAGGSWTLPEHQTMGLFKSQVDLDGPAKVELTLPFPELPEMSGKQGRESEAMIPRGENGLPEFYSEVAVLAYQLDSDGDIKGEVFDLSDLMDPAGRIRWEAPEGRWILTRYVCTNTGQPMISSTPNSRGPMIDHFSAEASERHINFFIDRLEEKLGKPIGESGLSYFYTDSYEVQGQLWTPDMCAEFEERMGYGMQPFLPALEGFEVKDANTTARFLYDYRRVLSDLIIDNHYAHTREICEEHGVGFVAEAAGPGMPVHNCPFESLKSSGSLSFPRGEFWHLPENSEFWRAYKGTEQEKHFLEDLNVIKGVASASHIYNQKYVEAEAFTGTHLWNEGPGDLKPTADKAFCEGLNRINFHTWPHTPEAAGTPGWAYAFGTLVNEQRIWWPMAKPWNDYLARCSYLLQQGNFVGDVLFYYGDSVPNFVPAKHVIEGLGKGYDYDVCNSDILLNRLEVKDGRIVLPHGQSYALLSLPDEVYMQAEILEKIEKLIREGATVVGPRPVRSHGLFNWEERDQQVKELADQVWGRCDGVQFTSNNYGEGVIYWGRELRSILEDEGISADFEFEGAKRPGAIDFIHRQWDDTDIYFLRNTTDSPVSGMASFRQNGKKAEYWDPATGEMYKVDHVEISEGTSRVPLTLDAQASLFIVFAPEMEGADNKLSPEAWTGSKMVGDIISSEELEGEWSVYFPEESAGEGIVTFDSLVYWNKRKEDGIRFFSGIASYEKSFDWEELGELSDMRIMLEFGDIIEVGHTYLNDTDLGILWKKPFSVEITEALKPGKNLLRIEVANTWANGLAGDARLPAHQRRTKTNVRRLPNAWTYPMSSIPNKDYDLIESGLAGPVKITTFKID
ncbi:MAG: glycosyl hydrolase, partial [Bacteroides sp.]|nr:glycosyl hydrolase [Bacteroides sp.]